MTISALPNRRGVISIRYIASTSHGVFWHLKRPFMSTDNVIQVTCCTCGTEGVNSSAMWGHPLLLQVLKGVSFTLEAGTSAGLVGPSGGGKSTVMVIQKHWAAFAFCWGCFLWACIEHRGTCAQQVKFGLVPVLVGKAPCDVSQAMIQRVWASFVPVRLQSIIHVLGLVRCV